MKSVPLKTTTVDMETGEETHSVTKAHLMTPRAGACQVCGHFPAHPPEQPHNAQSLYYQYAFYGEHGRWPTWKDALAHCTDDAKEHWERELRARGKWSEPEEVAPHDK